MIYRKILKCNNNIITKQIDIHNIYNTGERQREREREREREWGERETRGGRKSIVDK